MKKKLFCSDRCCRHLFDRVHSHWSEPGRPDDLPEGEGHEVMQAQSEALPVRSQLAGSQHPTIVAH